MGNRCLGWCLVLNKQLIKHIKIPLETLRSCEGYYYLAAVFNINEAYPATIYHINVVYTCRKLCAWQRYR